MSKQDGVERLKGKLYARGKEPRTHTEERTSLSPSESHAPVSWSDVHSPEPVRPRYRPLSEKPRMTFGAKFLIGSGIFFLGALSVAAYVFWGGGTFVSSQNIDLEVAVPSLVDGGAEVTLNVLVRNRNQTALQLADLIIDYPEGTRSPDDVTKELPHERQTIGTVVPGESVKRAARAVFFGAEGTQQKVIVRVEYSIAGSNAIFVKQTEAEFVIGSSPISLSLEAPEEAIGSESFPLSVILRSNVTTPIDNVVVEGQYPFGFLLQQSEPRPAVGSTLWRVGTLRPGESKTIRLVGVIEGQDGDTRVFRFLVGSDADQTNTRLAVPFLSLPTTLTIRRPFIAGTITVEGQQGKTISVSPGKTLQGTLAWQNNLGDAVSDVELSLAFSGAPLDFSTISSPSGFYQSGSHSIIWNAQQESALAAVPPGGTGSVQFSFATLNPAAPGGAFLNPTVTLTLTIRGVRQAEGAAPSQISSTVTTQILLTSALSLSTQALHSAGPLQNSGPLPPRADTDTSYTILWTVKNPSNTIANASVATVLPAYVRFLGAAQGETITYESGSRTVRWNLGDVHAGAGYNAPARTTAFQVVLTPSASQVGQTPALTGNATLSGEDRFAQARVEATAPAPTILLNESGFQSSMGVVVPK